MKLDGEALLQRVKLVAYRMGRLDAPFAVRASVLDELGLDEAAVLESNAQVCHLLRDEAQGLLRDAYRVAFARGRSGAGAPDEEGSSAETGARFSSEPLAFRKEAARVAASASGGPAPDLLPAPVSTQPLRGATQPLRGALPEALPVAATPAPPRAFVAETSDLPADFLAGGALPFDERGEIDFAALERGRAEQSAAALSTEDAGETVVGVRLPTEATLPFAGAPRALRPTGRMQDPPTAVLSAGEMAPPHVDETPELTLEQYASLCAEIIVPRQASIDVIFARYGLTSIERGAVVDAAWRAHLARDERLRIAWLQQRDAFVAWLRKTRA